MAADPIARGLAAQARRAATQVQADTVRLSSFYDPLHGPNLRPAYQAAINAAAAGNARVVNDYGAVAQQVFEPALDYTGPNPDSGWFLRNRTLRLPPSDSLAIDFNGAKIALRDPNGGPRQPGQTSEFVAGSGFATSGRWLGGFLTVTGPIQFLRLANVDVDGGFAGDTLNQNDVNLFDKGFLCQDVLGMGAIEMDNVVLHGFGGEIMYDNASRRHLSRDCHFYNSGHSCWNPNGLGRVEAYNLQAGEARQVAEVLGGKGHTYFGGRFYKSGFGGSAFIGGPDPGFGASYNEPVRRTDAPPPWVTFHGTRFEEFASFLYLGAYMRGRIETVDTVVWLASGFAASTGVKDIDLDIVAWADRASPECAVALAGAGSATDPSRPRQIALRVHCGRTELAAANNRTIIDGLRVINHVDPGCTVAIDGTAANAFSLSVPGGGAVPAIAVGNFGSSQGGAFAYVADDTLLAGDVASRVLYGDLAVDGEYLVRVGNDRQYGDGQRLRLVRGDNNQGRIFTLPRRSAGMRLAASRTLIAPGDFIELRYNATGGFWSEEGYVGTPRQKTGWKPDRLATLLAWYDGGDAGAYEIADVAATVGFADAGRNGIDLASAGGQTAPAPLRSRSAFGPGRAGLVLDGTDDGLFATLVPGAAGTPVQAFAVFKPTVATASGRLLSLAGSQADTAAGGYVPLLRDGTSGNWTAWSGGALSVAPVANGQAAIVGSVIDGATHQMFVNGTGGGATAFAFPAAFAPTRLGLGAQAGGGGGWFGGAIAEVLLLSGAVTVAERQTIEGYLAHKWGLAASLPAAHPYRNAAP